MKLASSNARQRVVALLSLMLSLLGSPASAQKLETSKNRDFSTADHAFTFNDTLYARVTASHLDYTDLDKNEFRLKAMSGGDEVEGAFTNHFNGTYSTSVVLAVLNRSKQDWELRVEIKDRQGNEYKNRVDLTITDSPPPVIVELEGRIEAVASASLQISGKTIFVDTATRVTELGQPLKFEELRAGWKVRVRAEERAENRLWALTIEVLERASGGQVVETRGRLANIQDSVIIVNEIRFRLVTKTELRGKEGTAIRLSDLRVGMLVEARGTTEATGKLIADRVKVEDDNFAGQEIQFTGVVNALFARPPLPDSIRVNGDLFEVGPQTELRGFFDEPIALAALRPGETVELKALTRMSRIPLALRLIRKAVGNGDVQVKGPIERLLDSSLVVSRLEFFISPATLILDDENFFISFSELRAGMVVAVSANRQANGRLLTTHIKLEDEANDEVELTAFIEALSDTSLVVSRTLFRVTGATVVLDKNRVPITFSALRLGMLVEVRGDRRFDGSVRATEIRIEDFLNDEIELRGAIAGLGGDSLRVTRLTFFVDVATVILDLNGNTISLAQLAVGAIVQIRADRTNNRWRASRIKVENEIDTEIAVAGRIDSLGSGGIFHALGRPLRVIEHTILLDANNDTIRFVDLRVGMIVEAQGRRLSDGSLIARRVKVESFPVDEVAVSGPIMIHGAQSIAVTSIAFAVNTATVIVDVENRPLLFTNLRDGQIVEARGIRVPGGGFLATRLQLQEHRLLTGIVDQIATNSVSIAGLVHLISSRSILVDEQNQPVGASEIKSKQQVRLVAGFTNGRWEILYLRLLFRGGPVAVKDPPSPSLPRNFVLYQNFPNPFWSGTSSRLARKAFTVIRFELSQPAEISLIIYNSLGQKIRTLTAGHLPAGLHERVWDGRDDAARKVAAGVYFYQLQVGQHPETRRMIMW